MLCVWLFEAMQNPSEPQDAETIAANVASPSVSASAMDSDVGSSAAVVQSSGTTGRPAPVMADPSPSPHTAAAAASTALNVSAGPVEPSQRQLKRQRQAAKAKPKSDQLTLLSSTASSTTSLPVSPSEAESAPPPVRLDVAAPATMPRAVSQNSPSSTLAQANRMRADTHMQRTTVALQNAQAAASAADACQSRTRADAVASATAFACESTTLMCHLALLQQEHVRSTQVARTELAARLAEQNMACDELHRHKDKLSQVEGRVAKLCQLQTEMDQLQLTMAPARGSAGTVRPGGVLSVGGEAPFVAAVQDAREQVKRAQLAVSRATSRQSLAHNQARKDQTARERGIADVSLQLDKVRLKHATFQNTSDQALAQCLVECRHTQRDLALKQTAMHQAKEVMMTRLSSATVATTATGLIGILTPAPDPAVAATPPPVAPAPPSVAAVNTGTTVTPQSEAPPVLGATAAAAAAAAAAIATVTFVADPQPASPVPANARVSPPVTTCGPPGVFTTTTAMPTPSA
jgi:hypothetical protein